MNHFYDKATEMGQHAISCAAIIDSKGEFAGRVIVRYTAGIVGWNHEVGVLLSDADLDMGATLKGDTYSSPATLYEIFNSANVKCFDWRGRRIGSWVSKYNTHDHAVDVGAMSGFSAIQAIKVGNKKFKLVWVM